MKNKLINHCKDWSSKDTKWLKKNYYKLGVKKCSIFLKRTESAILNKALFEHISKPKNLLDYDKVLTKEFLEREHIQNKKTIKQIRRELHIGKEILKKYFKKHGVKFTPWLTCGKPQIGSDNGTWCGYKEISGTLWKQIKNSANVRNLLFRINIKYIWRLFLKQDRKCALSGIELKFDSRQRIKDGNASLDRIDSSKGYIKGNVQWVHKDLNTMKMDLTEEEFLKYCVMVVKFNKKRIDNFD